MEYHTFQLLSLHADPMLAREDQEERGLDASQELLDSSSTINIWYKNPRNHGYQGENNNVDNKTKVEELTSMLGMDMI